MNGNRQDYAQTEAVHYTSGTAPQRPESASSEAGPGSIHYSHTVKINMLAQPFIPVHSGAYPILDANNLKAIYDSIRRTPLEDHILKAWKDLENRSDVQNLVANYFSLPHQVVQWAHDFNCDCIHAQTYRLQIQWELERMKSFSLPQDPTSSASSNQIMNYSDSKRSHDESHGSSHRSSHGSSRR